MKACINGIGVVGGFGCGIDALVECLERGVSPLPSFSGDNDSEAFYPAYIADTSYLGSVFPKKALRRIDHFSQLALTGAFLAINDAGGVDSLDRHSTGLVICSGYGSAKTTFSFLDSLIDFGDTCASPTLFSNSVHNAAAGHISILLGLEGPCLTVSQFEMSVPSGLLSAMQWLDEGRVDKVLFGAVDEYCNVLGYCYQRYYGRRDDLEMSPFVPDQQTAVPAEGAVFFILSKSDSAEDDYCVISSVKTSGRADRNKTLTADSFYILNADGHKECDKHYSNVIPQNSPVSCYTPLYGSMPVGPAFDMAIASVSFREGKLFQSPGSVGILPDLQILKEHHAMDRKSISCIKVGREGESGIIKLSKHI